MLKKIALILFVFMILYYPPFFTIKGLRILTLISWILLLININGLSKSINLTEIIKVIFAGLFVILYIVFIGLLHQNDIIPSIAGFIYCYIAILPASILVAYTLKSMQYDIYDFVTIILKSGMLQSIVSLSSLLIPTVKSILITGMLKGHVFQETTYTHALTLRMFGYSTGLTYGMPIVQTFLAMAALYLAFEKKLGYMLYIPFLLASAFINSRTSAIVAMVCLSVLLIIRKRKITSKVLFRRIIIVVGIIAIIILLPRIISLVSPETYKWVQTGYNEIFRFVKGDTSSGYFNYLVDIKRWEVPKNLSLLFGTGIRIMSGNNQYNIQSDIGYINDLWLGGIFLTICTYFFWIRKIIKIKDFSVNKNKDVQAFIRYIWITFLIVYIVINIKGYAFDLNNFTSLFILFIAYTNFVKSFPEITKIKI